MNKIMATLICTFVPALILVSCAQWIFTDNPFNAMMSVSAIIGLFLSLFHAWTREDMQ